ncbi:DUF433 domain-containing protein [Brevundimonas sp. VNH65]|uniref:DUF433 domain-containing protein n=1 Tax=Brevundimonas sp. VNH65 TaxID=3400917 RepID=UPI003C04F87F
MARAVVSIPEKFGGAPHIEGTDLTIAEVQAYWRQPGIYAAHIRERFPELSEAELGAAVTWAAPKDPQHHFIAERFEPSRQRFAIYGEAGDWSVLIESVDEDGAVFSSEDYWEATLEDALRYFREDALENLKWTDAQSGLSVDLATLNDAR